MLVVFVWFCVFLPPRPLRERVGVRVGVRGGLCLSSANHAYSQRSAGLGHG